LGEVAALSAWKGNGAAKLLAAEPSHGAMLLERLDYSRSLNDVPIEEAIAIAGRLLRRLAIEAPAEFTQLRDWSEVISRNLPERWERYGRPMPRRTLDHARELTAHLGEACTTKLLVNYDLHYADTLVGAREPWLVVDPMVIVGDLEFGIAQLLWTRLEDMEAQRGLGYYFNVLTEAAELEPALARDWTLVRCVDYWLWGLSVGLTYDPARCERIINRLTAPEL
jgi:streptomycin 6-kinase